MMAIASTTAAGLKTISIPMGSSNRPTGPRRPTSHSNRSPVATGGMTSGRDTSVSITALPRKRYLASTQASAIPGGSITTVAARAAAVVNSAIVRISLCTEETGGFEDSGRFGALQPREQPCRRIAVAAAADERGRINDPRPIGGRDRQCERCAARGREIRAVDDCRVCRSVLDGRQSGPHARRWHYPGGHGLPDPELLKVRLRVHTGRNRQRIADGDSLEPRLGQLARGRETTRTVGRYRNR